MGFFVGVVVLIICAVITGERKYLIPSKDKSSAAPKTKKTVEKLEAETKSVAVTNNTEPEFKNSAGLNILLYVGCFLVISALMGYISTVDRELIPPMVISITAITLITSILTFKFVKFLKPSSYAFNVTALIMFFFWIPSLTALGLSYSYAVVASFFFMTGAGIISSAIFKHKALWFAPAFSSIFLIGYSLVCLDHEISSNGKIIIYGAIGIFYVLGILLRLFWKARVKWLPVQTRRATRAFSFIYPLVGCFFTLIAMFMMEDYPFAVTASVFLLSVYALVDSVLNKSKNLVSIIRVCFETICIAAAMDICAGLLPDASELVHKNVVLATVLISSVIQAFISIGIFAAKHDEESHTRERYVFAGAIIGFAACSLFSGVGYSTLFKTDSLTTIITLSAQFAIIIFSILALILDKNALMLIIASMALCDIAITSLSDMPLVSCIILSVGAVLFSLAYNALKFIDQKHALKSSIIAAIVAAFFGLCVGTTESLSYIPILGIGLSMSIQGFLLKNTALRITGIYTTALGIINAWLSVRTNFSIAVDQTPYNCYREYKYSSDVSCSFDSSAKYPEWVRVIDSICCLVLPAAAFFLSAFDKKTKLDKDDNQVRVATPNVYIGVILGVFMAICVMPIVGHEVQFFSATLGLIMLIGILIWSTARKWLGFEITALCAILFLVLENVSDNLWITLIIAGLGIIGIVIYISYKNYKKLNNKQTPVAISSTAVAPKDKNKS